MKKTPETFELSFFHQPTKTRAVCTVTAGKDGIPSRLIVSIRNEMAMPIETVMQYQEQWHDWFGQIGQTDGHHPIPSGWKLK